MIVFNNKYIIDGHHRWSQIFCTNPNATIRCLVLKKQGLSPEGALKAIQLAIASINGDIVLADVKGSNLFLANEQTVKDFIIDSLNPEVLEVFGKLNITTPEQLADYMWSNCKQMQNNNRPIPGAPTRGFMPQTDENLKGVLLSLTKRKANTMVAVEEDYKTINKILIETYLLEYRQIGFKNINGGNFVVMMGSPGAGKSFVANNLLALKHFKVLNSDNWIEIFAKKQNIDLKTPGASEEMHKKFANKYRSFRNSFIQKQSQNPNPPNIVLDITGKNIKSIKEALALIENSNYTSTLIYVITSKEEAIKRNLNRDRQISTDFLISVYDSIQETYTQVINLFDNVWVVLNDEVWDMLNRPTNRILKIK